MLNKKAQGMSTNTIILLILGMAVLVVLIIGFSSGWSAFKNIAQPTNVDKIRDECNSACSLGQTYSFCSADRTLRVNEENLKIKTSCAVLAAVEEFRKYKFEECPSVTCDLVCEDVRMNDKKGSSSGDYDVSSLVKEEKCFLSV